jgi:hypothetical protein
MNAPAKPDPVLTCATPVAPLVTSASATGRTVTCFLAIPREPLAAEIDLLDRHLRGALAELLADDRPEADA